MDEFKLAFISSSSNSAETWHMEKKKRKEEKLLNITSFLNEWFIVTDDLRSSPLL